MKKFLVALVLVLAVVFCGLPAMAGDKQLIFQWEQTLTSDFYGWKLYMSETAGGPYIQFGADIVYDGNPASDYSSTEILTSPDGQEKTYYFVVNAWDIEGNFSGDSNEVNVLIDFLAPGVPVSLTVTVQAVP